jgi:NADH-quinone oxidoreductase subunit E
VSARGPLPSAGLRLPPDVERRLDDLARRYPTRAATILHVLWAIQEREGWISEDGMRYAAERCDVPLSHVLGVVSFYTMFRRSPPGKHHVQVCRNITCTMLGAEDLLACAKRKLRIESGERTADGRFSLEEVECLAGCSWAPVVQVNRTYHENMTAQKLEELLDSLGAT